MIMRKLRKVLEKFRESNGFWFDESFFSVKMVILKLNAMSNLNGRKIPKFPH